MKILKENAPFEFEMGINGCLLYYKGREPHVEIPNGVMRIASTAFSLRKGCVESVHIPDSVKTIEHGAFDECVNLVSTNIPIGIETIKHGTFYRCYKLENIIIPNTVKSIERIAFCECYRLTSIVIPDSVESIGDMAFISCKNLKSIYIPDSVKSFEDRTLSDCPSLQFVFTQNQLVIDQLLKDGISKDKIKSSPYDLYDTEED